MIKEIEVAIKPYFINDNEYIKKQICKKLNLKPQRIIDFEIIRKSIDSRKIPIYKLRIQTFIDENKPLEKKIFNFPQVKNKKEVIVVGSGPSGLFGALKLIELGFKPIVVERGKDVQSRRKDLRNLNIKHEVNSNSNYCFGEGGAGTYSDGKLYTRSTKRGDVNRILDLLINFGADPIIGIEAHPHIGSNNLPKIIKNIRTKILECGGEIRFDSLVTDFILQNGKMRGVVINDNDELVADAVLLATGHSARDIYYLLNKKNIKLEAKPFAMGVRIEHPQKLIDSIQYNSNQRHPNLPPADYSLACQVDNKGVYSFCMCPGGIIVPASTSPGELVLNGMSVSRRDSAFANAGFVVSITEEDWQPFNEAGVFAGLNYQKYFENLCFNAGGKTLTAPAQRITDFVNNKTSSTLPETSYKPGTISAPLHEIIPENISRRMKEALVIFNQKMKGYFTEESQILAPESRTSSPVRIPRNKENFMHIECKGLFPSGEGAGYAGGIVSAAIDGENCAKAIGNYLD